MSTRSDSESTSSTRDETSNCRGEAFSASSGDPPGKRPVQRRGARPVDGTDLVSGPIGESDDQHLERGRRSDLQVDATDFADRHAVSTPPLSEPEGPAEQRRRARQPSDEQRPHPRHDQDHGQ